ncbi:unnamed protein product [Ectocarpus sp. 8 AP-2014]
MESSPPRLREDGDTTTAAAAGAGSGSGSSSSLACSAVAEKAAVVPRFRGFPAGGGGLASTNTGKGNDDTAAVHAATTGAAPAASSLGGAGPRPKDVTTAPGNFVSAPLTPGACPTNGIDRVKPLPPIAEISSMPPPPLQSSSDPSPPRSR